MNKPIRTVAIFCLLLFLALMVNVTYLQYWRADSLDKNPNNRRVIVAAYSRDRGAILVGRTPVAESKPSDDQYDYQRTYAKPFEYAPITGYFSYYAQTGVEQSQNRVLSGDDNLLFVNKLVDLLSNKSAQGGSVELTINAKAQDAAYEALDQLHRNYGDVQASVVALEPSTGRILAMASIPTYDPNQLASHDFADVSKVYAKLDADPDEPLLNRAIQTTLPPGSTFKLVTASAAIENGLATADGKVPGGTSYQLPLTGDSPTGLIDNEGRDCGTGDIDFTQALGNSCNTTFAQLGVQLGADKLKAQADKFGFDSHYLDDLGPQAVSVFPSDANEPQAGQSAIGQFDVRATPLQMAMVSAAIANQGKLMRPYIVDEVQSPEFDVLKKTEPTEIDQAVSAQTADEMTKLMVYTVESGTASPGQIPGVTVAGKTGTAQSGQDDVPPYAWFTSFAPAQDPEVAVAVMIQKIPGVERGEIAGGVYGGPIAKAVEQAVIQ